MKQVDRITVDNLRDVAKQRFDVLNCLQQPVPRCPARPEPQSHIRANVQPPFDMLMNARIDDSSEFLIVEGSTIFFDQSTKLVNQEIVTLDTIIEFFKRILGHKLFEPQMAQMTRRGNCGN